MGDLTIRPAYSVWPKYDRRLREVVAAMTDEQLAFRPSPERWPLWATVGHLACQRVFWLCDFAGEPGAETTRFTNAALRLPGGRRPRARAQRRRARRGPRLDVPHRRGLPGPMDARACSTRRSVARSGTARLGPHPRLGHPAGLQPRRLPLRRAERDARGRRAAADRPLGLRPSARQEEDRLAKSVAAKLHIRPGATV